MSRCHRGHGPQDRKAQPSDPPGILLAEAQQAQAEALRKQRELDEKTRDLEITIEKRVQSSQAELTAKARQDASDELKTQVLQKDTQIESLGRTVDELKRKLERGSRQTQGGF
jgi:hypothetical protein